MAKSESEIDTVATPSTPSVNSPQQSRPTRTRAAGSTSEQRIQAGRISASLNLAVKQLALRLSTTERTVLKEELLEEAITDLLKKYGHPVPESH